MPSNPDYSVNSILEEIYKREIFTDYGELRKVLSEINETVINIESNMWYSQVHTSYTAANRNHLKTVGISKDIPKKVYYGIVLYAGKNVYIDVPPKNSSALTKLEDFNSKDFDLKSVKEFLFFDSSFNQSSDKPVVGGIAAVQIPDNYPNHILSNDHEAVYLGMYNRKRVLAPSVLEPKVQKDINQSENKPAIEAPANPPPSSGPTPAPTEGEGGELPVAPSGAEAKPPPAKQEPKVGTGFKEGVTSDSEHGALYTYPVGLTEAPLMIVCGGLRSSDRNFMKEACPPDLKKRVVGIYINSPGASSAPNNNGKGYPIQIILSKFAEEVSKVSGIKFTDYKILGFSAGGGWLVKTYPSISNSGAKFTFFGLMDPYVDSTSVDFSVADFKNTVLYYTHTWNAENYPTTIARFEKYHKNILASGGFSKKHSERSHTAVPADFFKDNWKKIANIVEVSDSKSTGVATTTTPQTGKVTAVAQGSKNSRAQLKPKQEPPPGQIVIDGSARDKTEGDLSYTRCQIIYADASIQGSTRRILLEKIPEGITSDKKFFLQSGINALLQMFTDYKKYVQSNIKEYTEKYHNSILYPKITSGYRNTKNQITQFDRYNNPKIDILEQEADLKLPRDSVKLKEYFKKNHGKINRAAFPGFSNHESGLALDIKGTYAPYKNNTPDKNTEATNGDIALGKKGNTLFFFWMSENARFYGFRRTVSSESWHWEFREQWLINPDYNLNMMSNDGITNAGLHFYSASGEQNIDGGVPPTKSPNNRVA